MSTVSSSTPSPSSKAPGIPKQLSHIWVGPLPPPKKWMASWQKHHPDWNYTLYDNHTLDSHQFRTRRQIEEYLKRGQYAGVADLMRLEILYQTGGLMPGADSICLQNTDHLFPKACAYTVYENELIRGELVSPIQACEPGNPLLLEMIEILADTPPEQLDEPWISSGNLFTTQTIKRLQPEVVIFPSHYLIPVHFTGVTYEGDGPIYAKQMFGTTQNLYQDKNPLRKLLTRFRQAKSLRYQQMRKNQIASRKLEALREY